MIEDTKLNPDSATRHSLVCPIQKAIAMRALPRLCLIFGIALPGCAQRSAIDRVVEIASRDDVPSYLFMPLDLPETAAAEHLVSALARRGELHGPVLMKVQQVQVRSGRYTAVLLNSGDGKRVVLLRPLPGNGSFAGWYYKIYDPKQRF